MSRSASQIQIHHSHDDEQTENYFKKFIGTKLPVTLYKVTWEKMVAFCNIILCNSPEYTETSMNDEGEPDYTKLIAHPSFPSCFTIRPMFQINQIKDPNDNTEPFKIDRNLLPLSQSFNYECCVPIRHGQVIKTLPVISNIECRNQNLYIDFNLYSFNLKNELVVRTKATVISKKHGSGWN